VYTPATKNLNYKATREGCPYDIPRKNDKTGVLAKCTMCIDRIKGGQIPACVKACPTGALQFGERDKILAAVKQRVEELKKKFPKAQALNPDDVRVIYIVKDDPAKYWKKAAG
jgi:formate dehydrogenase iron-sulfur subunit